MLGNGSVATVSKSGGFSKGQPQEQPRKHEVKAMRYVEGHLYVVTGNIDQRGEGEEPIRAGTILRVVEDLGWCVRFEHADGSGGDDVVLSGFDKELKKYSGRVFTRARRRAEAFTKHYAKAAALVLLCGTSVSMFLGLPDDAAKAWRGPPLAYNHVWIVKDHVKASDQIELHVATRRTRNCVWQWNYVWSRIDGTTKIAIGASRTEAHHIPTLGTDDEYNLFVDLPRGLTPGQYEVDTGGTAECEYHDMFTHHNKPLRFTVD